MIAAWWAAHEVEYVATGVVVGICALIIGIEVLAQVVRERRRKRKDGIL